jgi:hypothetical protein
MSKRSGRHWLALSLLGILSFAALAQVEKGSPIEYVFEPEENRRVLLSRYPYFYEGHLNNMGCFVPDPRVAPIKFDLPIEKWNNWADQIERAKFPIFNRGRLRDQVYQYIAGDLLIPGQIVGTDFYPNVEGNTIRVTTMADYLKAYDPKLSYRIYNLPGRIVPKAEARRREKES